MSFARQSRATLHAMNQADPSLLYEALASVYDDWQRA